jgi:50S ribosomal protein L11
MAGKITAILNLEVPAGKANPAPPLGPALGAKGVNIGQFTKEFNEKTQEFMQKFGGADVKVRCTLTVYADRTFDIQLKGFVTSNLILRKLKKQKGSGEPNKTKIGTLTRADLEEIAELQKPTMNSDNIDSIIKQIAGTAKNMGVEIEAGAIPA